MKRMTDFGLDKQEAEEIAELVKLLVKEVGLDVRQLNKVREEFSINNSVAMENMRTAVECQVRAHLNGFVMNMFVPLIAMTEKAFSKESFSHLSNEDNYVVKKVMVRLEEVLLLLYGKPDTEIKHRIRETAYCATRHLCQIQIPTEITNAPWNNRNVEVLKKITKLPSLASSFPDTYVFGKPHLDHTTDFPEFGKTEFLIEQQSFQTMIKFPVESIVGDLGFVGNDIPESVFNNIMRRLYPESKGRKIEHYLRDSVEKKIRELCSMVVTLASTMKQVDRNVYKWSFLATEQEKIDISSLKWDDAESEKVIYSKEPDSFVRKPLNEGYDTYSSYCRYNFYLSIDDDDVIRFSIPGLVRVIVVNDSVSNNIDIMIATDVVKMSRQEKILLLARLDSLFSRPEGELTNYDSFKYYVEQAKEQIQNKEV